LTACLSVVCVLTDSCCCLFLLSCLPTFFFFLLSVSCRRSVCRGPAIPCGAAVLSSCAVALVHQRFPFIETFLMACCVYISKGLFFQHFSLFEFF
jgi:hypothetical protein